MPGNSLENPVAKGGVKSRRRINYEGESRTRTVRGESRQSTPNVTLQRERLEIQVLKLHLHSDYTWLDAIHNLLPKDPSAHGLD